MAFLLDLTIGTYLGLLCGLSLAALFVAALRREQRADATQATTRDRLADEPPRLVELLGGDATAYTTN